MVIDKYYLDWRSLLILIDFLEGGQASVDNGKSFGILLDLMTVLLKILFGLLIYIKKNIIRISHIIIFRI